MACDDTSSDETVMETEGKTRWKGASGFTAGVGMTLPQHCTPAT